MSAVRTLYCAVYTRKSSEEGLEQSFNSLDAQREACEAFILSQSQEGWRVLVDRYDDGGFSGGTIERPALKRLLDDVESGKVNVIVVYKVDRLTRSLTDFAKIVEALDAKGVSFVSVTQQFNTTSSMGRLTLNVLLSFAQFEREVTGERIRDKIAASKKKGMWMGGLVPLGYDVQSRKLIPNQREAALVCRIFSLYAKLACVSKLAIELEREKLKSKVWTTRTGGRLGGVTFSRGALYHLLRNHIYIGEIRHRDHWYPGEHKPIVPLHLWKKVQERLTQNLRTNHRTVQERSSSLLTGFLEDGKSNRFTPSFTNKAGRRYRYYVSRLAIENPGKRFLGVTRVPAKEIENLVCARLRSLFMSDREIFDFFRVDGESPAVMQRLVASANKLGAKWNELRSGDLRRVLECFVQQVIISEANVQILLSRRLLRRVLESPDQLPTVEREATEALSGPNELIRLSIEAHRKRCGGEVHLVVSPNLEPTTGQPRASLIKAIVRAHDWHQKVLNGRALDQRALARQAGLTERYVGKVFACAFLAPDIVEAILAGRQPRALTFEKLTENVPLSWADQRVQFGFPRID